MRGNKEAGGAIMKSLLCKTKESIIILETRRILSKGIKSSHLHESQGGRLVGMWQMIRGMEILP